MAQQSEHGLSAGEHDICSPYAVEHAGTIRLTASAARLVAGGDTGGLDECLEHLFSTVRADLIAQCEALA